MKIDTGDPSYGVTDHVFGSSLEQEELDESVCLDSTLGSLSIDKSSIQNNKLSDIQKLWSYCEKSKNNVQLILPDSLIQAHYLPMPKIKKKSEMEYFREQRRIQLLAKRELDETFSKEKSHNKRIVIDKTFKLSPREEKISEKLLSPYRREEVKQALIKKFEKKKLSLPQNETKRDQDYLSPSKTLNLETKRIEALQRKKKILEEEESHRIELEKIWNDKIMAKEESIELDPNDRRLLGWIAIVKTLVFLKGITKVANNYKKTRQTKKITLKSVFIIQRAYRRWLAFKHQRRIVVQEKIQNSRLSMILDGTQSTFFQRQRSAIIILDFLRCLQKSWKSLAFRYSNIIKAFQREYRVHQDINANRIECLNQYLDRLFPSFHLHMNLVHSGSGLDLNNVSNLDLSRLKTLNKTIKLTKLIDEFNCPKFHQYLRSLKLTVQQVKIMHIASKHPAHPLIEDIKRRVLFDFLYEKKRKLIRKMNSVDIISLEKVSFTANQAMEFIKNGTDPLKQLLLANKSIQDQKYEAREDSKRKFKTGEWCKGYRVGDHYFCLLNSITAIDYTTILMRISEMLTKNLSVLHMNILISTYYPQDVTPISGVPNRNTRRISQSDPDSLPSTNNSPNKGLRRSSNGEVSGMNYLPISLNLASLSGSRDVSDVQTPHSIDLQPEKNSNKANNPVDPIKPSKPKTIPSSSKVFSPRMDRIV